MKYLVMGWWRMGLRPGRKVEAVESGTVFAFRR